MKASVRSRFLQKAPPPHTHTHMLSQDAPPPPTTHLVVVGGLGQEGVGVVHDEGLQAHDGDDDGAKIR